MPYFLSKHTVSAQSAARKVPIYLSRPTVPDKRPVIMVIHEFWGLTDHVRGVADRYASLGYIAAAPDLFGGVVAKDRNEAAKLSKSVSTELSSQLLTSALDFLTSRDFVNQTRIGIHGFCFGGTHAFNFACESKRLAAATIFYASILPPKEKLSGIKAPMLIVYGDKDQIVKIDQVKELQTTMKKLKKNVQFEIYPGAQHAFFNETAPNYNEAAAASAWEKAVAFFGAHLPVPKV
jgi:carboxymethylenebutenolidase